MVNNSKWLKSKITQIAYLDHLQKLILGTKQGELLLIDHFKKEEY